HVHTSHTAYTPHTPYTPYTPYTPHALHPPHDSSLEHTTYNERSFHASYPPDSKVICHCTNARAETDSVLMEHTHIVKTSKRLRAFFLLKSTDTRARFRTTFGVSSLCV